MVQLASLFPYLLCNISCVISVSPVYREYISTAIVTYRYFTFLRRKCIYAYCLLIVNTFVVLFSLFPDLLCNIGLSVSGLRKIRFNTYTLRRIFTKKSVAKETRIPVVHVNNLRLVFLRFSVP